MKSAGEIFDVRRTIVKLEHVDDAWVLELSCGHTQRWAIEPPARPTCKQCLDALVERFNTGKGRA